MELSASAAFKLLVVGTVVPVFLIVRHLLKKHLRVSNAVRSYVEKHGVYKVALMMSLVMVCLLGAVVTIAWS